MSRRPGGEHWAERLRPTRRGPALLSTLLVLLGQAQANAAEPEPAAAVEPEPVAAVEPSEPPRAAPVATTPEDKGATTKKPESSKTQEPAPEDDGNLDISNFLDSKFGFLPIVSPITEPAVGFGAAGALMFISKPLGAAAQGLGRPNITAVGGFGTANGSWGVFGMDLRYWADDRVQTIVAGIGASVNLDYYGTGQDSVLHDNPLRYNLQPIGGVAKAKYRFGDSRIWSGLGYTFSTTAVTFTAPEGTPGLPNYESRTNIGMLTPFATWDTRDNMFTPLRGTFLEANLDLAATWLGGDNSFQRLTLTAIQYFPLPHRFFLGLRADGGASFGDAPFYMRPSIGLRGVPAMRYQGQEIAQLEVELRWQFYGRWSVLGFMGGGGAWNNFEQVQNSQGIVAGGTGFRYEIARKYGIHAGVDVAFSRDTGAVYLQVGSAWMRP